MGERFSEFSERRDEYETDESKHEHKESVDEKGCKKTDPESWMKEVAREVEEQEVEELLKAERFVREFRRELEWHERIEAEERRAAEEWMKAVVKEIEKMEKEEELEKEKQGAEKSKGWDPTRDELDDYEKDIAKGFEVAGATEEEIKERWRERYVEEIQNIIEKEPRLEKSSPGSLEGTVSFEEVESRGSDEQLEEYVESGDGTTSTMIMEQSSNETLERESDPENPSVEEKRDTPPNKTENSESTQDEYEVEEKTKKTSQESVPEKKEYNTYTERPTHHSREIDSYSEEENSEPSEKFREDYESRLKPTQFSENDRAPKPLNRVVNQVEKYTEYPKIPSMIDYQAESYFEPSLGKVELSEEPKQKTSKQKVYEDSREDMSSKESEHEFGSERSIDSKEKLEHQDKCNNEPEAVHEIEKHLEERMEGDVTETEDMQESSYEHEPHQDELKDVTFEAFEDESEIGPESSHESSKSYQEEVEEGIESVIEQQTIDEVINGDECTENEEYASEVSRIEGKENKFEKPQKGLESAEISQGVEEYQERKTEHTIEPTAERTQEDVGHIDKALENKYLMYPEVLEIETSRETCESEVSESLRIKPHNEEVEHIEETDKPVAGEEFRKTEYEKLEVSENPTNEKEFGIESYETESHGTTETGDNPFQETQLKVELLNQTDEGQLKSESVDTETNERLLSIVRDLMKKKLPISFSDFGTLLDRNSYLRKSKNYEKKYYHAKMFYQIIDNLLSQDYSQLSANAVWKLMSEKYKVAKGTIKSWFTGNRIPKLISEAIRAERKRLGLEDTYHREDWESIGTLQTPKSKTEFIRLLTRHPHLRDREDFDEMYRDVLTYFTVKEIIANDPNTNISELARQLNYPRKTIHNWARDKTRPKLFTELLRNERLRTKNESKLSQDAHSHRINPSLVYKVLRPLKDINNLNTKRIANALERLLEQLGDCNIIFAELHHYNHRSGQQWMAHIQKIINLKIKEIEKLLNERLRYNENPDIELRLGLVDSKLYIWIRDLSQFDFANLFTDEFFFFDKPLHKQLTLTAQSHLGLKGDYNLSKLVKQLTDYSDDYPTSMNRPIPDFRYESEHFKGGVLKFLLDAQGQLLKNLEEKIQRIGIGEQILNPHILDNKSLEVLMARLYAIVASDGTINQDYSIRYSEKDDLRREIVSSLFMKLGHVVIRRLYDEDTELVKLLIPNVLGRVMAKLGMPVGDKVLQGILIPPFILNGSPEVQAAYLEEVIPEEGWFTILNRKRDRARIGIRRGVVLYDLDKADRYNFTQKIPQSLAELFLKKGKKTVRKYHEGHSAIYFEFSAKSLEQLQDSKNKRIAHMAKMLLSTALDNPPELLIDERSLGEMNGIIMTDLSLNKVSFSKRTGRISALWHILTSSQADVARWGLFAPPNDACKQSRLALWMKRHPELIERARLQMSKLGILRQ